MEAEGDDQPTCGKGIAASAALPEIFAALASATANMLHNHIRALDPGEPAGKAETDAYQRLVAEHRAVADRLEALAVLMRGYRDLPMASHDMGALTDQTSLDAFTAFVLRERELLALLQERVKEHGDMLAAVEGER
jgi:hypothetical protein